MIETSALASMIALPRKGHLGAIFHMVTFLDKHHNGVLVFDPTIPNLDKSEFQPEYWSATAYGDCVEDIPGSAPPPRGLGFTNRAFVDSDHTGDNVTRRSRTGFIIFMNSVPIYWYSKKQTSIETSSFGSEFIAMNQCCEYVRGLRYKLRMLGIPVEQPTFILGDNQSVLANTSVPHSKLKKKSSSIAYHFVREVVAKSETSLPGGEKRNRFTSCVLHYLGSDDDSSFGLMDDGLSSFQDY